MLKTITYCYAALLAVIVLLANFGELRGFTAWLHRVPFGDKAAHFVLVGAFSFLVSATLSIRWPKRRLAIVAGTIFVLAALASMEELSQSALAYRQYDPADMLCNVLGICVFGGAALGLPLKRVTATCSSSA